MRLGRETEQRVRLAFAQRPRGLIKAEWRSGLFGGCEEAEGPMHLPLSCSLSAGGSSKSCTLT